MWVEEDLLHAKTCCVLRNASQKPADIEWNSASAHFLFDGPPIHFPCWLQLHLCLKQLLLGLEIRESLLLQRLVAKTCITFRFHWSLNHWIQSLDSFIEFNHWIQTSVCAEFVPKILNVDQNQPCVNLIGCGVHPPVQCLLPDGQN